jgi:hypothetical protein
MPGWVIGLIAVVGSFVVLSVLVAVAVPVFLSQRAKAHVAATRIVLPDTVLGLPRQRDFEASHEAQLLAQAPAGAQLAVYAGPGGSPALFVVVVKGTLPHSAADQAQFWSSFERSLQQEDGMAGVQLVDRSTGAYGGRFACGSTSGRTVCAATDDVVQFSVLANGAVPGGTDAVASVRAQVEHQTG